MNKIKCDDLSPEELFIVKWQYRILGHFGSALIGAIERADDMNLDKLRLGFPDEVNGYMNYTRIPGWWANVKGKAGIDD